MKQTLSTQLVLEILKQNDEKIIKEELGFITTVLRDNSLEETMVNYFNTVLLLLD